MEIVGYDRMHLVLYDDVSHSSSRAVGLCLLSAAVGFYGPSPSPCKIF